jgi:hypothetical protein
MKRIGTSERYQNNNLKAIIVFSKFLDPSVSFYQIKDKSQIFSFLDTKIKSIEQDPDKRCINFFICKNFCVFYLFEKKSSVDYAVGVRYKSIIIVACPNSFGDSIEVELSGIISYFNDILLES